MHVGTGAWSRDASLQPHVKVDRAAVRAAAGRAVRGDETVSGRSNVRSAGGAPSRRERSHERQGSAIAQAKREARERRRAERRRARRRRTLVAAVCLVLVTAAVVALYRSQLFEIRTIEVVGAKELATQEVIDRAAVPEGATLLRFPRRAIEQRLLEDPWVARVVISRDFPSTLRIRVEERAPAALVDTGEAFWVVDASGLVLAQASLETSSPLVVIRDVPGFDPKPGRTSNSDALVNALRVLEGISPALGEMVRAVSAPSVDETALITATGVEIMIGEATELERKSALVLDILAQEGAGVVFVDVRSTERPISRGLDE